MRSELFEETLKQHKDSLTDELVQLGKHRQAQLVEWDIEQNESNYEFYFDSAWNYQQSKVDELQKRVDAVKQLIEDYRDPPTEDKTFQHALSIVADELEQALKGGES